MNTGSGVMQRETGARFLPWLVTFSAALFFFYEFIQMNMFNAIDHDLIRVFAIDAKQLGHLSAIYFYANVIFLFPAGILLDRYSTKKIILTAMVLCVAGTLLFATAQSYWLAYFSRFLTGIGSAFCFLSCIRIATRWFPAKQMALISGLIVTMAMMGGMVAQTPLILLVDAIGWRHALLFDAALGLAIIAVIALLVRDYPPGSEAQAQKQISQISFWQSLRASYFRLQNWLGAIYTCMLNMPLGILGVVWGVPYLTSVHHLSDTRASLVTSMIFLGTIIGAPLVGRMSDRLGRRKLPMITGAVFSLATILVLLSITNASFGELMVLFLALGFFTSHQVISYPTIAESNSPALTATAVSVISFTTQGGDAVFQSWFGDLVQSNWSGEMVAHVPHYSAAAFEHAFLMIPVGFVIAIIAAIFIKETNCRAEQ